MANKKLLDALNKAIAMDLRATIQYMWQHVMALGVEGVAVNKVIKKNSNAGDEAFRVIRRSSLLPWRRTHDEAYGHQSR